MTDIAEAALKWVHLQQDRYGTCGRMTLRQIAVLGIVADRSPIDFADLSACLGLTKPVATRAIYTLGQMGLVQQVASHNDRRRRLVSITEQGEEFRNSLLVHGGEAGRRSHFQLRPPGERSD